MIDQSPNLRSDLKPITLHVNRIWPSTRSEALAPQERPFASLTLTRTLDHLKIDIVSTKRDDPPPPGPAGPLWALWNYEVVECFIVGGQGAYLELEFGPYGHHLALQLSAPRVIERAFLPIKYLIEPHSETDDRSMWSASATLDRALLPPPIRAPLSDGTQPQGHRSDEYRVNAFACWGPEQERSYAVASPLGEGPPDFHRPHLFPSWSALAELESLS
jgi:hypothetical protein